MKNGLESRLGHGFAKFGRAGAVWRWEYSWNTFYGKNKENIQHGYDKGFLSSNVDIFERLKTRFLKSVLLDSKYYEKANNFKVFLCDNENKKDDKLIFTVRFFRGDDGSIESVFTLQEFALLEFSKGTQNYFQELFSDFALQIKNSSLPKKKVSELVNELNNQTKTLQQRFIDAINIVFDGYEYKSHFYKVNATINKNRELVLIFPLVANIEDIEAKFSKKLLLVAQKMDFQTIHITNEQPKEKASSLKSEASNYVNNQVSKFKS